MATPFGVRLLVGDVMGTGLPANRTGLSVLNAWRDLACTEPSLAGIAVRLHALIARSGHPERFVTALLRPGKRPSGVEIRGFVRRLVGAIRAHWPRVGILLRADSGFAREPLMAWCEDNRVDYLFGLARNERLTAEIAAEIEAARVEAEASGKPARRFRDFTWSTLDSWSRRRRIVGKAEWTGGAANPRFIVTSLKPAQAEAS